MKYKSTEISKFLDELFYHSFNDHDIDIDEFIDPSGPKMRFNLVDFVEELKKRKTTFGFVPYDSFFESECSKETIGMIEDDYFRNPVRGGFSRLFLEYLFDERFKKEFNKILKDKSEFKGENYFSTKTDAGKFEYDLIGEYFDTIKNILFNEIDFSVFTERKAVRSTKESHEYLGTEKLNNIYSAFKIFAQGEYSKILISILEQKCLETPAKARNGAMHTIMTAEGIKDAVPKFYFEVELSNQDSRIVESRIVERQMDTIEYELQRFFEDFVPSNLDRKFSEKTLRENLKLGFLSIAKEEWKIYKEWAKNDSSKYEKYSMNRPFSKSEVSWINRKFISLYDISESLTIREKIQFLSNIPELQKNNIFQDILKKYQIFALQGGEKSTGVYEADYGYFKKFSDESKRIVIEAFKVNFAGERQFLSDLEDDINKLECDVLEFLSQLKGKDSTHPWGRFWTIYKNSSEINLFSEKKSFTKAMNEIEKRVVKHIEDMGGRNGKNGF